MRRSSLLIGVAAAAVGLLPGCTKQARKARAMTDADRDFNAGDYNRAEVEYRKALALVPYDPDAIRQLGLIYHYQGRVRSGYAFLKKSLDLDPHLQAPFVKAMMAQDELALGAGKKARETAEAALVEDPANVDALLLLVETCRTPQDFTATRALVARLRQQKGDAAAFDVASALLDVRADRTKAEAEFRSALARDPKIAAAHAGLASLAMMRGDRKTAAAELQAAVDVSPMRSIWRLRQAEFEVQSGAVAEAQRQLADLTAKVPDYVAAWVFRMKLAFAEKQYDACASCLHEVITRDPGNFDAALQAGTLALARGNVAEAIDAFKDADKAFPRQPFIQYQLANAYLRNRDFVLAEQHLNSALLLDPSYVPAVLILSELEISRDRAASAIGRLTRLIQAQPRVPQAYLVLGRAYLAEKNTEGALRAYQAMATMFPRDPQGDYHSGLVHLQEKNPTEARRSFERAVAVTPGYAPAEEMLVNLDLIAKQTAVASSRINRLIAQEPASGDPWLLKAKIDLAEHNEDAAKADLTRAIALNPDSSTAYQLLTRLYLSRHQTAEAEKELQALATKTNNAGAYLQLSILASSQRRYDAAKDDLNRALAINPKMVSALVTVSWVESEHLNQPAAAEEHARRARELAPQDPQAARVLGWILVKKGSLREALPLLQESAEQLPTDPDAQYRLATAYYFLGDEDLARSAFHRALGLNPDSVIAGLIRGRLAMLDFVPSQADAAAKVKLEAHIKAEPNDGVAMARVAECEELAGDASAATEHYRAALAMAPGNATILLHLAQLYVGPLHDPAKALESAKAAHVLAPNDANSALILGRLAARVGDFGWSLDLLQQASRSLGNDPAVTYDLAWAYYRTGQLTDAQDNLTAAMGDARVSSRLDAQQFSRMLAAGQSGDSAEKAVGEAQAILRKDPHYLPAEMVVGLAEQQQGKLGDAEAAFNQVLQEDPSFAPASLRLAAAEYELGHYSVTARIFHDITRQNRELDSESRFYFGMSLYRLKDNDAGKVQLQRALAAGLPEAKAAEARRALSQIK